MVPRASGTGVRAEQTRRHVRVDLPQTVWCPVTASTAGGELVRPQLRPGHRMLTSARWPTGWRVDCECGEVFHRSGTGDRYLALRDYQDHAYRGTG